MTQITPKKDNGLIERVAISLESGDGSCSHPKWRYLENNGNSEMKVCADCGKLEKAIPSSDMKEEESKIIHTPDIIEKARELAIGVHKIYGLTVNSDSVVRETADLIAAALAEARAVPDGWDSSGLLSCPFCQGDAYVTNVRMSNHTYFVSCVMPECVADVRTIDFSTEKEAMRAWNTRAAPNPPIAGGTK